MSSLAATVPLYSSRPRLRLDGRDDARLDAGVLTLSVHEDELGLSRCELTMGNWGSTGGDLGFLYFDRQVFDFGRELSVEIGEGDAEAEVFTGKITGIEGRFIQQRPPEILVLAEDRLQDLRMVRRTRTFEDVTLNDVVETIASDHGLQAQIDIDSPNYRVLAQLNQSDLAFLRERARLVDAEVWVRGNELLMQSRSRRKTDELTLCYKQRLHEFSVLADLAHQRTHLAVGGWDVGSKSAFETEVDKSIMQQELNGRIGGSGILEEAFGRRRETVAHLTPASDDEARQLSETCFRGISRRFVTGRGLAEGDGRLKAGSHVTLDGLGDLFSGEYYVNEVQHLFCADKGYRTYFHVERAGIGVGQS